MADLDAALGDIDWQVIFVDDDSLDGTIEVARAIALQDQRVRPILRVKDRGLTQASIQGLLSAKADTLCVMDGDGQHGADVIPRLIAPLKNGSADIVSAARKLDEQIDATALSSVRRAIS